MKNVSIIISLLFGVYFLAHAKPDKEPYFVKMKNVKFKSISFETINFTSEAVFFNTYKAKAALTEVYVDIYVEDKFLGTVTQIENVDIPKESAFDIPLNISTKTTKSLSSLLWQSGRLIFGKDVEIKFDGYIKIKALNFVPLKIPISTTESYKLEDIMP